MLADDPQTPPVELKSIVRMDRVRGLFKSKPAYHPIENGGREDDMDSFASSEDALEEEGNTFSWVEYFVFLILGAAMLWAW